MDRIILKEKLPQKVRIIGGFFIIFGGIAWSEPIAFFTFISFGTLTFIFRIQKEVHLNFRNKIKYQIGSLPIFVMRWRIPYPDYISLFKIRTITENEWGPVAALGKENKDVKYCVRFFTNSNWINIYTTTKKDNVLIIGQQLENLLHVEVLNKT